MRHDVLHGLPFWYFGRIFDSRGIRRMRHRAIVEDLDLDLVPPVPVFRVRVRVRYRLIQFNSIHLMAACFLVYHCYISNSMGRTPSQSCA